MLLIPEQRLLVRAMSRKRYFDIEKYLHFNDNTAIDTDRCYKVRPIYTLLNETLQQFDGYTFYIIPYQGAQKENGSENSSERLDKAMKTTKKEKKTLSQTVMEKLLRVVET
ncbi:hypothetical protein AVEN_163029-1 [Araneus ventricosus]|uniref:PiggyBac transposable element-derived protein domain-containing protein n=1 Tax=Araneus ventricosus TaxID=182803 RepID=A0A4Y2SM54_ARAVE|nr:hypothetical protein AVEN_133997-1 [Araneus ventricosus]GBN89227.1 hypothetical protein AVEN_163029-1 [Araneus ventricosus]